MLYSILIILSVWATRSMMMNDGSAGLLFRNRKQFTSGRLESDFNFPFNFLKKCCPIHSTVFE